MNALEIAFRCKFGLACSMEELRFAAEDERYTDAVEVPSAFDAGYEDLKTIIDEKFAKVLAKQIQTVVGERPADVEEHWSIWNASRPIPGSTTWNGPFIRGRFFAAFDPFNEQSEPLREQCLCLDAAFTNFISQEEHAANVEAHREWLREKYADTDVDSLSFDDVQGLFLTRQNRSGRYAILVDEN